MLDLFAYLDLAKARSRDHLSALALPPELKEHLLVSIEDPSLQFEKTVGKLCFYCQILLQASKLEGMFMQHELEEILSLIHKVRCRFLAAHRLPLELSFFQSVDEKLSCFYSAMQNFFSTIVPFLEESKTNENLLIYLLEHKNAFNQYLGERSIERLLRDFFPLGRDHLHAVIYEGFTKRGFTAFLESKEHLIKELIWEAPCLCTQN